MRRALPRGLAWCLALVLALPLLSGLSAKPLQASPAFERLSRDLKVGRYREVWSEAENAEDAAVLALGADAAASHVFCARYDEASRPVLDRAIALAETAIERDPAVTEGWLQFARAKGGWLRNYAFTPDLMEACTVGSGSFTTLFKIPRLLGLKQEAGRVTEAFQEALALEPMNGVALVGLAATELLEPLHPCVDDYSQEKGEAALRRMAEGLATPGRPQLKSFIAAEALQEARDKHGLSRGFFRSQGLDLDALWQRASQPCEEEAYCRCMAAQARSQLTGGAQ